MTATQKFAESYERVNANYNSVPEKVRQEHRNELLAKHPRGVVSDYLDFLHTDAPAYVSIDEYLEMQSEEA